MDTPPPIPKRGENRFSINELTLLSQKLPSFLSRLMATIQIVKYIAEVKEEDMYNWEIALPTWKVTKARALFVLEDAMKATLAVYNNTSLENYQVMDESLSMEKRHLMAVVAYMICFGSNPYLGEIFFNKVVIDQEWELGYFGAERTFAFAPSKSNLPDPYYQAVTLERWHSNFNEDLKELLSKFFIDNDYNIIDKLLPTLFSLFSRIITKGIMVMVESEDYNYRLSNGKYLMDSSCSIIGVATQRIQNNREDLYLKNLSGNTLELFPASGNKRIDVRPEAEFPLRMGMTIVMPRTTHPDENPKTWKVTNLEFQSL